MKVLIDGSPPPIWRDKLRCTGEGTVRTGCNALLLVEWGDLFRSEWNGKPSASFRCPCCGVQTDVPGVIAPQTLPGYAEWHNKSRMGEGQQ